MKFLISLSIFLSVTAWGSPKTIVVVGDSLTEGLGVDVSEAYPAVLQSLLQTKHPGTKVINGGVSGSTAANAVQRVRWFARMKPDILVMALGANDGLRGVDVASTHKSLVEAIRLAKQNGMKVLLAGMRMPTNYGEKYRKEFEQQFRDIARTEKVALLPFLLDQVGGDSAMNQADGIHPNAAGQKKIAEQVAKALEPLL